MESVIMIYKGQCKLFNATSTIIQLNHDRKLYWRRKLNHIEKSRGKSLVSYLTKLYRIHLTNSSIELPITNTLVMYTDYIRRFKSNCHTTFDPLIVLVLSHMLTHTSSDSRRQLIHHWLRDSVVIHDRFFLTSRPLHSTPVGNVAHNLCDTVGCYIFHHRYLFHSNLVASLPGKTRVTCELIRYQKYSKFHQTGSGHAADSKLSYTIQFSILMLCAKYQEAGMCGS